MQVSPAEHFARIGYDYLLERLPDDIVNTQPSDDDEDDDPGLTEHWRQLSILTLIRGEQPAKKRGPAPKLPPEGEEVKEKPLTLAGVRIHWPNSLPQLAVWRGARSTLQTIIAARQAVLWAELSRGQSILSWQLPLGTQSGIDPRGCVDAIDAGFSPDAAGIDIIAYPAAELLAIVGMEVAPITRLGYERYGYRDAYGVMWEMGIEERAGTHYRRLSYAKPTAEAANGTIRQRIVKRAAELGMTKHAVARAIQDAGYTEPTRSHVYRYWDDDGDMTGERLDAILAVLGLELREATP